MRIFVSIDCPQNLHEYIATVQNQLFDSGLFEGRPVQPEQLHSTIVFLGEVDDNLLAGIQAALRLVKPPAFEVCLENLMVLPSAARINVICFRLMGEGLQQLSQKVHGVLESFVKLENRSFCAHLTIAQVKKVTDKQALRSYVESFPIELTSVWVDAFFLKQSILSSPRAQHTIIEKYVLR